MAENEDSFVFFALFDIIDEFTFRILYNLLSLT